MKLKILGIFSAISIMAILAYGQGFLPELVDVSLTKAYIPLGFDSNDRVQVVVEGKLPNACYSLGPIESEYNEKTNVVTLTQHAYLYQNKQTSLCKTITDVPFKNTVELGLLKAGQYKIHDGRAALGLGELPVAEATNDGPDDYFYAIVEEVQLTYQNYSIVLQGYVPSTCWSVTDARFLVESENVITLLPIIKYTPGDCSPGVVPFAKTVKVPATLKSGRYLVQVRSLNGQSINKLINF